MLVRNHLLFHKFDHFEDSNSFFFQNEKSGRFYLSADGKWIVKYVLPNEIDTQGKFQFFNIFDEHVVYEYVHPIHFSIGPKINHDASRFVLVDDPGPGFPRIHVVELNNDKFLTYLIENTGKDPRQLYFSALGDRLFFHSRYNTENYAVNKQMFVDRCGDNWLNSKELIIYDRENLPIDHDRLLIKDIANNGRSALVMIDRKQIAVAHEIDGIWKIANILDYSFQIPEGAGSDNYYFAETGNVIAIQSVKEYERFLFDIFLFFLTPSGEWVKKQVNAGNVNVLPDILLSDDGTRLYWTTENNQLSAASAEELK